jgi:hypothetical protein
LLAKGIQLKDGKDGTSYTLKSWENYSSFHLYFSSVYTKPFFHHYCLQAAGFTLLVRSIA